MQETTMATLSGMNGMGGMNGMANNNLPAISEVGMSMGTVSGFEAMQRAARLFASSKIVPQQYYNNIPDCFIAVDMAARIGASPLLIMQNLFVIHGRPAWTSQFLIATLNRTGRFTALDFKFYGTRNTEDWGCRACATEIATGEKMQGTKVTIGMAIAEGWMQRTGSKWKTMPELMLRYRAAAFFVRQYAPEIAMGLYTVEEETDRIATKMLRKASNSEPVLEPVYDQTEIECEIEQEQESEEQEEEPEPEEKPRGNKEIMQDILKPME